MKKTPEFFMREALKEAMKGLREGGIPIGAVLVRKGKIIARGHNRRIQKKSAILHAEMDCLEKAGRLKASEYRECQLYSTLSPCPMCSGAIELYKIPVVYIGENRNFKGPEKRLAKTARIINLKMPECEKMMADFIKKNPKLWNEDIGI